MASKLFSADFLRKLIMNGIYFSGAHIVCKRWTCGLGSILMLHHVRDEEPKPFSPNSHLTITPQFLDDMLASLVDENFDFVSLDEAVARVEHSNEHRSKNPFLAVTLDDGYRDNMENAAPIFRKYNMPYTIYVAPGFVDGFTDLWWEDLENIIAMRDTIFLDLDGGREEIDTSTPELKAQAYANLMSYLTGTADEERQRRIVKNLAIQYGYDAAAHRQQQIMSWSEIAELNKDPLCTIGAHTISHPALARLTETQAKFEIKESARVIESELGEWPKHFAYPYGMRKAAARREFDIAKECGFASAATTRHGVVHAVHKDHLTALPRISVNGGYQAPRYIKTLISGIPAIPQNKGRRLNVS